MDALRGVGRTETLGERLLSLRPGDGCPCCGAQLCAVSPGSMRSVGRVTDEGRMASWGDALGLVCPECGCEIDSAECPPGVRARRTLGAAA